MIDRTQAMARAYTEQGLSYAQIGEEYGLTRQRVGQLLGPLGLARDASSKKAARVQRLRAAHERILAGRSTLESEAEFLGYKSSHVLRNVFYELGLRVVVAYPEPPHGTYSRYHSRRYHCRCDECRRANRERQADLQGRKPPNCGTYSGYVNYGCRCQPCKEAHRLTLRDRRIAKRRRKEVKV